MCKDCVSRSSRVAPWPAKRLSSLRGPLGHWLYYSRHMTVFVAGYGMRRRQYVQPTNKTPSCEAGTVLSV